MHLPFFAGAATLALTLVSSGGSVFASSEAAAGVQAASPAPATATAPTPAGAAASTAPVLPAGTPLPAAKLTGRMQPFAWLVGRWACRSAVAAASSKEPAAAKLWVQIDGAHDALREEFSMATAGKPYRSDDALSYDPSLKAYVRRSIDVNKAQVVLAAKAPYTPAMNFEGFVSASDDKLYRMRAGIAIDAAQTLMTTSTSFYHADSKSWVVQSTAACSKISN